MDCLTARREAGEQRGERAAGLGLALTQRGDDHQVAGVAAAERVVEQLQGRVVAPLQVLEHDHQRLLRPREALKQLAKHATKPVGALDRRQRRDLRLRPEHALEIGEHVEQQPSLAAEGRQQPLAPRLQRRAGLGERLAHQRLHALRERGVRRRLIEPATRAGRELPATRGDLGLQLVQDRRLADADRSVQHRHLRWPGAAALEHGPQRGDLLGATDQPLRQAQPLRPVRRARFEVDRRAASHVVATAQQIGLDPVGALIPTLRGLGEQLEHDLRESARDRRAQRLRGDR